MVLILFRSRLTGSAGDDYAHMAEAMRKHAEAFPGFVDIKSFTAEDGERLSVVRWQDHETLAAWRNDATHRHAQRLGRERWYEYFVIEVADLVRSNEFRRAGTVENAAGTASQPDRR